MAGVFVAFSALHFAYNSLTPPPTQHYHAAEGVGDPQHRLPQPLRPGSAPAMRARQPTAEQPPRPARSSHFSLRAFFFVVPSGRKPSRRPRTRPPRARRSRTRTPRSVRCPPTLNMCVAPSYRPAASATSRCEVGGAHPLSFCARSSDRGPPRGPNQGEPRHRVRRGRQEARR